MLTVQLGAAKNSSQGKLCQLTEGYPWLIPCPIPKKCLSSQPSIPDSVWLKKQHKFETPTSDGYVWNPKIGPI
jgi:hypothetical protein